MKFKPPVPLILVMILFHSNCRPQKVGGDIALLKRLDSVQHSSSIARHFGSIYFATTENAINFFKNSDEKEKDFIHRLETRFAEFFFRSAYAYEVHQTIPAEWASYFRNDSLKPLQYKLLGINAHINGDIWQALTSEFSLEEIKEGHNCYLKFQKALAKQYREFYNECYFDEGRIRMLHGVSAGMDKFYGNLMLARWRKRQLKLAMLYYTDPDKFQRELDKVHLKMEHINQLVLQNL